MNKFEALVEIVNVTSPDRRLRSAIFAIFVITLPAAAGVAVVFSAFLRHS